MTIFRAHHKLYFIRDWQWLCDGGVLAPLYRRRVWGSAKLSGRSRAPNKWTEGWDLLLGHLSLNSEFLPGGARASQSQEVIQWKRHWNGFFSTSIPCCPQTTPSQAASPLAAPAQQARRGWCWRYLPPCRGWPFAASTPSLCPLPFLQTSPLPFA